MIEGVVAEIARRLLLTFIGIAIIGVGLGVVLALSIAFFIHHAPRLCP